MPADGRSETFHESASINLSYTGEMWQNVRGGASRGNAYLDNLDISAKIDAEALWGWSDTELFVHGLYNNGGSISKKVGDLQAVSNIEAGFEAVRLHEAWIETTIGRNGTVKVGLYDLNSEFDVLESSALFIHGAHGMGTGFGQSGENGPSIFPVTSLSLRFEWHWTRELAMRLAVLDAVPGDPSDPGATVVELKNGEGALIAYELQWSDAARRVLLGAWGYTAGFDEWPRADLGSGNESTGNAGFYIRGEAALGGPGGGVSAFGRVGTAAEEFNVFAHFFAAGFVWQGILPRRPDDSLGLAVASAKGSRLYRDAMAVDGRSTDSREVSLELTYRVEVSQHFALQPNFQYVINPGLDPTLRNSSIIGIRFEMTLRGI